MLNLKCYYLENKTSVMWIMTGAFTKIPDRVKAYLKENWGAPFIIGFLLFLLVAAFSLVVGSNIVADGISIAAYFSLVIGVILQLVCFLKCNKKNGETYHGSS